MELQFWQYIIGQVITVFVAFGGIALTSFLQNRDGSRKSKAEIKATSRTLIREVIACTNNFALSAEGYYRWLYDGSELNNLQSPICVQKIEELHNECQAVRSLLATYILDA